MPLDAITNPTTVGQLPTDAVFKAINGREADASTAIDIESAPGAGKTIYILSLLMTCDDDDAAPQLQDGDGTVVFGPVYAKAAGPIVVNKDFKRPLKLVTNKSLALKAAAGGNVSIWAEIVTGTA